MFDTDSKFLTPAFIHKLLRSAYLSDIVDSLTILFYKYPISKASDIDNASVIDCLVTLAGVINTEKHVEHYARNQLEYAFERLVRSAYLNGLFKNTELSSFLENSRPCYDPSRHIPSSDDSDSFFDDDSDDMNMGTEDEEDDVTMILLACFVLLVFFCYLCFLIY